MTLIFLLWQSQELPLPTFKDLEAHIQTQAMEAKRETEFLKAEERKTFAERYNRLIHALQKFETDYRNGQGEIWPKRSADELAKALKAFESTSAWKMHEKLTRRLEEVSAIK